MLTNLDKETTARLRDVMIELLDELARICEENNLTYYITGGTLLGAVRHRGFIPWDDDIDVAMPRNDYEIFIDICCRNTDTKYYIISHKTLSINAHYHYVPYAKFCKKGTIFGESTLQNSDDYSGICIDIFPTDNSIVFLFPIQNMLTTFSWKLYRAKMRRHIPSNKAKRFFVKMLCCITPIWFCKWLIKISYTILDRFNTKYISRLSSPKKRMRVPQKHDTIFPLSKQSFEGKKYWAPGNWDKYLTNFYGNYRELPPDEQRVDHSPVIIITNDYTGP